VDEALQYTSYELARTWTYYPPELLGHHHHDLPAIGGGGKPDPQDPNNSLPCLYEPTPGYPFYNKAMFLYLTESALNGIWLRQGPVLLGGIWNAWVKAVGREPHVPLDDFFAAPIKFIDGYAPTLPELVKAHDYVCSQVRETREEEYVKKTAPHPWHRDPRYIRLHPLCEALLVVLDEYKRIPDKRYTDGRLQKGHRRLDHVAACQNVILVRTGYANESRLSAPTSFESLKNDALPLVGDEDMGTIDAIRVPLQLGVEFVAKLMMREEEAFLSLLSQGPI
jgi:hypothetical protein